MLILLLCLGFSLVTLSKLQGYFLCLKTHNQIKNTNSNGVSDLTLTKKIKGIAIYDTLNLMLILSYSVVKSLS